VDSGKLKPEGNSITTLPSAGTALVGMNWTRYSITSDVKSCDFEGQETVIGRLLADA
jgi:hypothetical protein